MSGTEILCEILKCVDFIENNIKNTIALNSISSFMLRSPFYFHRIFVKYMGRLRYAAYDLTFSNKNILDIALDYQFNSHDTFTRAFKRLYGITPVELRGKGLTPTVMKTNLS